MSYTDNSGFYHAFHAVRGIPLTALREAVTGDVLNIAGNGGVLASDTTPVLSGTGSTASQQLSWAASNSDQVLVDLNLPESFDGRDDVIIEMWVASGTTDPASFTCLSNWDGAAADVSTTVTDGAKSATVHKISARIPASSVPDNASYVSIALTPAAHTTDAIVLKAVRLLFTERVN